MLNFIGAHPNIAIGVLVGVVITFIIHVIHRIKRLLTTGMLMAMCGGGVASSDAVDKAAQFAHGLLKHLH